MQEHPKTNALENNIAQKPIKWPTITSEARPWTRWWWLGSAVDKQTITRLLETYREAGIGGVEITSIYGVKGQEDRNIEYLSPEWIEMVRHTIQEAKRLEMQVDLPPGSGWRMGGDFITDETSGAELKIEKSETGTFSLRSEPTTEPVKRPGPGGAGRAFNPFSRKSLQAVIDHFTPPFKDLDIRAQFHDSWEYMSDCCPELFEKFREKRGYDLQEHAAELAGEGDPENISRVRYDYRLTIAELALEDFIQPWTEWCHELGQQSRNQAHGSPGNLLDLYAAADIPETEVFRSITDMTPLISKFASSAAHVGGKKLVSSETGTWFKEHFNTSLGDMKQLVDNLFVSGINHHVYHGTCYSPADADWPGWLFYASAQLNPQNPIWRDFDALNAYIARC
ncbi:MAG: glycosyl hydrolase, partial [Candidatus Sumerlaeota bacterium]